MIRSAAFALLLSSAWLISAGPGIAPHTASAGQHLDVRRQHHNPSQDQAPPPSPSASCTAGGGGGLPKPIGDVVRSERTLNKPTTAGLQNFHPKHGAGGITGRSIAGIRRCDAARLRRFDERRASRDAGAFPYRGR